MDLSWLTLPPGSEWLRLDLLSRLLMAALLGGIIGLERESNGKPAGLRTNLLICVGAALFTDLSVAVARAADPSITTADPSRIAAQIVSGIGFLGAGTIMQARGTVTGLTTAATIWVVAAIGMAVGAGAFVEAIGTTALVVVALLVLSRVERLVFKQAKMRDLRMELTLDLPALGRLQDALRELSADLEEVRVTPLEDGLLRAQIHLQVPQRATTGVLASLLEKAAVERPGGS